MQQGFTCIDDYVAWLWSSKKHLSSRSGSYEIYVPAGFFPEPGKYVVAYVSERAPYSILGLSCVFEVRANSVNNLYVETKRTLEQKLYSMYTTWGDRRRRKPIERSTS